MADDIQNNDFSHEIIGAAVEVQRVLGTGLPEAVYAAALAIELAEREIGFERDVPVAASYKGRALGDVCRADFVIEQAMVVQVRAVDTLDDLHRAQAQAAVRLSGHRIGLLINFNVFPVVKGVHRIGAKP
ncbi:GxxExxY protein [Variovorax arabinosiphilus]|uniref:GxxExxY protein n=1 Tax=Variovorax arabinosiphilus TaxID=3053498 RepID=UPI00257663D2|nr:MULTISPECIES: GxxExxY protein [unclassified Variovorax]MDM0122068.1 GxxExxY protein [Variovorax sp. J2L1-78]MDM0131402.1 GxxExxY protein [Variovorax sp. J2L1-63]MDM0234831.1 GxxExxY protein [Variovorax sp. J2R1-6]